MKPLLLSFAVLLTVPASAQDWTPIDLGTTATLRAFEQRGNGRYLVGDGGFAALSDLTYTVWTPEDVGTTADLLAVIRLFSGGTSWAGGRGGVVRVRDAGGVWHARNIPEATQDYVLVERVGADAGVLAAGSGGSIWRTTDGGSNWILQNSGVTTSLNGGFGSFSTVGEDYLVGDEGLILKSINDGATWTPLPSGTTEHLYAIEQNPPNASSFVVVGANGTILTTSDSGATWTHRASGTTATLRAISLGGGFQYLAAGDDGTVLRTAPNTATWCTIETGVTTDLYAALMLTDTHMLVAGEGGVLLHTETGGCGCVPTANEPAAPPPAYALSAVAPNPVRGEATLTLQVARAQPVRVVVYDVLGRPTTTLYDGRVAASVPLPLRFDAARWPSGVYLVRAEGEGFSVTRSVVVVH